MRKAPSPLLTRSDDEWLIEAKGYKAQMKANVGGEPNQPPTTGWEFLNFDTGKYDEDPSLRCTIPSTSPPCCLTVSLSGAAKEAQGECEGGVQEHWASQRGKRGKTAV